MNRWKMTFFLLKLVFLNIHVTEYQMVVGSVMFVQCSKQPFILLNLVDKTEMPCSKVSDTACFFFNRNFEGPVA